MQAMLTCSPAAGTHEVSAGDGDDDACVSDVWTPASTFARARQHQQYDHRQWSVFVVAVIDRQNSMTHARTRYCKHAIINIAGVGVAVIVIAECLRWENNQTSPSRSVCA